MQILKADGKSEEFSEKKLLSSIQRAGIPEDMQTNVLMHIKSKLHENMHTSEIYQHILEFLGNSKSPYTKTRFSLKQSLMELGPTGYPFEDYLARLLQHMGYKTTTRVIAQGRCITHEIDVIASKNNEKVMVEAKFHNSNGIKTDVHVALYTFARFEDTKERNSFTSPMLITNTKATSEVVTYAQCMHMDVLGWDYPEKGNLRSLLEQYQLYPVTALTQLTQNEKQQLLSQGITLCKDLCAKPDALNFLNLPSQKKQEVLKEAGFVCQI